MRSCGANAPEQADPANRAKPAVLGVMSHELRTPLNGALGLSKIEAGRIELEHLPFDLDARDRDAVETT